MKLSLSSLVSLSPPIGTTPEAWGAMQAATLASFISSLKSAGHDVTCSLDTPEQNKRASVPANGKGKFEMAWLEWKGQDRMHHKGDKETESREQYARRLLIEADQMALVESLDNQAETPVGVAPTPEPVKPVSEAELSDDGSDEFA